MEQRTYQYLVPWYAALPQHLLLGAAIAVK
jgi:hypothetical protein